MNAPCRYCDHRALGCHGTCREYADWKKWLEKAQAARVQEAQDKDTTVRGLERVMRGRFRRQK